MTTQVSYRQISHSDVPAITEMTLSPKDAQEAMDGSGCSTVPRALLKCLEISKVTWVIEDDTGFVGVFGLGSREGQVHPWLLGTERLHSHHWFALCKGSKKVVDDWAARFPEMLNLVWADNTRTIKWLKWLGFGFPDEEPIDIQGRKYLLFKLDGGTHV